MSDERRDAERWGYQGFSPNGRYEPPGRRYGAGSFEGEDRGSERGPERWSSYEPGENAPAGHARSRYGYNRLEGQRPPEPRPGPGPGRGRGMWDRAKDELHAWMGDRDAEERRHHDAERQGRHRERADWRDQDDIVWSDASHRGRGPQGYRRPDARVGEDIADRLTDDPRLDASDIHIHVCDGEVTLSGRVASEDDRRRAEAVAERVSGVVHVQNALKLAGR